MARIIENTAGRRNILLSVNDVISVVREYQTVVAEYESYEDIRKALTKKFIYIPEEYI